MIEFRFDERKATQAAALIINLRGGRTYTLALVKLLYIVDKRALLQWGRPITGDEYYSLPHGPIGTMSCDLVRHDGVSDDVKHDYWASHIHLVGSHQAELVSEIDLGALSNDEIALIESTCEEFKDYNQWNLRDHTHERAHFPEWQDPVRGRSFFSINEMLQKNGAAPEVIDRLEEEAQYQAILNRLIEGAA